MVYNLNRAKNTLWLDKFKNHLWRLPEENSHKADVDKWALSSCLMCFFKEASLVQIHHLQLRLGVPMLGAEIGETSASHLRSGRQAVMRYED